MKCINRVELLGNLTQEPELKKTNSGKSYANLTIATNKRRVDQQTGQATETSEFHRCTAWNTLAETICKYLHKGNPLMVTGEIHTRSYEKDGQTKYITEIIINDLFMLPSGGNRSGNGGSQGSYNNGAQNSGGYGQQGYGQGGGMKPTYDEQGRPLQQSQGGAAPQGAPIDDVFPF